MPLKRSQIQPSTKPMKRHNPLARESKRRRERVSKAVELKKRYSTIKAKARTVSELARWSKAVRANAADGMCERCRIREGQHAHHVAPRSRRPDLRLVVENGRWVCPECHQHIHRFPQQATEAGWLSDVPYEMRDEIRVKTELEKAA